MRQYNSEENIEGVVKLGIMVNCMCITKSVQHCSTADEGMFRPLEHLGGRCSGIVVKRGHVGWTVGDNRGSTEQKQMAATSGRRAGSTVGMSQIAWSRM